MHNQFIKYASEANLLELNSLVILHPNLIQEMLQVDNFAAFRGAAENGHLAVVNRLVQLLAPTHIQDMVSVYDFAAFGSAAQNGHLPVMERLLELTPDLIQDMLRADHYHAFRVAAENGHLSVMQRIVGLTQDPIEELVRAGNFYAFREAAAENHLPVIEQLLEFAPNLIQDMVSAFDYYAFCCAAQNGHLSVIDRLVELITPTQIENMVQARGFFGFGEAANFGHLSVIERIVELTPDLIQDMLHANDFAAFRGAADNGHLTIIDQLVGLPKAPIQDMLRAKNYYAFCCAAENGHLAVIDRLVQLLVPAQIQDMVSASDFSAFHEAATNGHLPVIERLLELTPDLIQDMLRSSDYYAFRVAAENGHLSLMQRIVRLAQDPIEELVRAGNFYAFREAAAENHLPVIEQLLEFAPHLIQDMVSAFDYYAFCCAAQNGHLSVIDRLVELITPTQIENMVRARDFFGFGEAANFGHLSVIERIVELTPDLIQDMLRASDYYAFRLAAENGHLSVMQRIVTLAQDPIEDMVRACDFYAFHRAAANCHDDIIERLLGIPLMFGHVESYPAFASFIQTTVDSALANLRQEITAFNHATPSGIFDISTRRKIIFYFYIMRNLIRQNTQEAFGHLSFLLSIPSLKALAHQGEYHQNSNELLRLAMSINNHEAVRILFDIPSVNSAFYHAERERPLDIGTVIEDPESSMQLLTQLEIKGFKAAMKAYEPEIIGRGVADIMQEFTACLRQRYCAVPALVKIEGSESLPLPLEFHAFKKLALPNSAQALKSYYQHPVHTAYRYLSKPNHWMAPDAEYVYHDPQGAWSTFEEFQPSIALLFLAAKDETRPGINGYSIATRIGMYIEELALIGRAHNWDDSRHNFATGKSEEFDDLQGDKPSCARGVMKRLLQSVHDHPLLQMLSKDSIHLDVCTIVSRHFESCITHQNYNRISQAWDRICETGVACPSSALDELNFNQEQKTQYILQLETRYGDKLHEELRCWLHQEFEFSPPYNNLAEKFGGEPVNLMSILERKQKEFSASASVASGGLFRPEQDNETNAKRHKGPDNSK